MLGLGFFFFFCLVLSRIFCFFVFFAELNLSYILARLVFVLRGLGWSWLIFSYVELY